MQAKVEPFSAAHPTRWLEVKIDAVVHVNPESLDARKETPFRYIDISLVSHGNIDWATVGSHSFRTAPSRARRVVRPDDVLLCTVRPGLQSHTFASWHDQSGYVCSTGFAVLRPTQAIIPRYLYHLIFSDTIVFQIRRLEIGSNYPAINESDVRALHIPLPPLSEQRRIAEILDTVDAAIQRTEALIAKLKQMKAGLLHDLLTRGIDEHGQLRDLETHPEQFRESTIGSIPAEWIVKQLGKVARVRRGASPRPIDNPTWFADEGPGWVRISDVTRASGRLHATEQHLSAAGVAKSVPIHPGQVIMSICATIGEPVITAIEACIHDGFVVFDQHGGSLDPEFLVYYLRLRQDYFRSQGQTGTQANLNTAIVKASLMRLPPLPEQRRIVSIFNTHDARIRAEEAYRDKLKFQKKGLMDDLLTGRVRVTVRGSRGMKISTILDQVDLGSIALPEFQRGYVWNRDQVRGLMYSLYRKHPVGSLLVWVTKAETAKARNDAALPPGTVELLLDGQQRITSLYGIVRGKPPRFFDGNAWAFTGVYFHLESQVFEFYAPQRMKDNPLWVNVTGLMQQGVGDFIQRLMQMPDVQPNLATYINRLTAVHSIQDIDLHIERVTGEDKTIDDVVDIFNRVNSGGTKLSKGDLALARICAGWPEARPEMKACLGRWEQAGFSFTLDWLLRNVTTILRGEAMFAALVGDTPVTTPEFQAGLQLAEKTCNYLLNMVSGRLGLDHDRVLGGRYAFPVMSRYVTLRGGKLSSSQEQHKLLYWYIHSFLWGRFAGSTETIMNQDLRVLDSTESSADRLIEQLRRTRGDLRIRPEDFSGSSLGARFYPLLYLLTRVHGARDWGSGLPLSANQLGKLNALQVHHIFPKALLYQYDYGRGEVNAVANFCFLTQITNLDISATLPADYFETVEQNHPGALASQWIPLDRNLWKIENYRDFLAARRQLLADATNRFLDELLQGKVGAAGMVDYAKEVSPTAVASSVDEAPLEELVAWCSAEDLPKPELHYEVCHLETGAVLAIVDAAWPQGIQEEYSQPTALLLERDEPVEDVLNTAGYRFFTSIEALRQYLTALRTGSSEAVA